METHVLDFGVRKISDLEPQFSKISRTAIFKDTPRQTTFVKFIEI